MRAEATAEADVQGFLQDARDVFPAIERTWLNGPMPAPMARRAGKARGQLLLGADARGPLHAVLTEWLPRVRALPSARRVRWSVDVDPMDLY